LKAHYDGKWTDIVQQILGNKTEYQAGRKKGVNLDTHAL